MSIDAHLLTPVLGERAAKAIPGKRRGSSDGAPKTGAADRVLDGSMGQNHRAKPNGQNQMAKTSGCSGQTEFLLWQAP